MKQETNITVISQCQAITLDKIEYRMELALTQMHAGYIELGRCLNEAKERGLVPHGSWGAWVQEHALMSERQAQKLMQIARSVPDGSAMARLGVSKVHALLSLPEANREEMAVKVEQENMTLAQLRREVKAANDRAAILTDGMERAQAAATQARADLTKLQAAADAEEKSYQQRIDQLTRELQAARVEAAQASVPVPPELPAEPTGISPEAQARIDQLTRDLEVAEEYAEQQADLRQQAQQLLQQQERDAVYGEQPSSFTVNDLAASVRMFIASAGVLPHMGATLARAGEPERQELRQYVSMVETWVQGAKQALSTYVLDN